MQLDVAVVGGGVAGLTCGWALRERGAMVKVFEPHAVGGLIQSSRVQGYVVERGPNVFLGKPPFVGLLERLGLLPEIAHPIIPTYRQYIWDGTKPVAVPRNPIALLKSPLASFREKISLLRGAMSRRTLQGAQEDESVQSFLGRALGDRIVREVADTTLKGIFGGNVEDLSARSLFPGLWDAARKGCSLVEYSREKRRMNGGSPAIVTLRGGNATLPLRLEALLGDSLERGAIEKIRRDSGSYIVCGSDGVEYRAKAVVIACPGIAASRLIANLDEAASHALRSVHRAPLMVVHLAAPVSGGPLPEKGFGVLFPRGEPSRLLGVMFNSELFPHQAPPGGRLLTVCLGGVGGERALEAGDDQIFGQVIGLIECRLGLSGVTPLLCTRWPSAIPQYEVGHWKVCAAVASMEQRFPGITFIGAERGGIGVPDRVDEALRVAREVSW